MEQLSRDQAIKFSRSGVWKDMTDHQIVNMQLQQNRICIPYEEFQSAMVRVLGRGVYTHELANPEALLKELNGEKKPPTLEEIIEMIPEDKRILFNVE